MIAADVRRPTRVTHTYVQCLRASASSVFPLLCPVREIEWVPGWAPLVVISDSGVAEDNCVFVTTDHGRDATWVVTQHDPDMGIVEMVKVTPGFTVTRLRIALADVAAERCHAEVTYTYTALGPDGARFVSAQTLQAYEQFMQDWERHLNDHLAAGERGGLGR